MPHLATADEWLRLSAQLLEARPTTTRVSTRYSISPARLRALTSRKAKASASTSQNADVAMPDASANESASTATLKPPRAKLILKTFDPHSGVCLKYKTTKAQEVGRLVQMLGSLGRNMAALPAALPAAVMDEDATGALGTATSPVAGGAQQGTAIGGAPAAGGDGGKGKKKKKGKR
ncbi:signal recognition particle 9 kDa protein-domain-containing protein [Coniella lustricola]|uniref:Signal recognition particle 9 kDa protein-domain-containing protein n=1 Tax=Coniella lustricola TaxID=2025994 RepID=A0A2T3AMV3_9PEZI|nr:signal recognition particle 9 kDa protein-domain-containing protein [Coniella lustricola]